MNQELHIVNIENERPVSRDGRRRIIHERINRYFVNNDLMMVLQNRKNGSQEEDEKPERHAASSTVMRDPGWDRGSQDNKSKGLFGFSYSGE